MNINIPKNNTLTQKQTNYFWIVDLSGSMYGSIKDLKKTLSAVKDLMNPGDTFSLAYFSSSKDYNWICKGANINAGFDAMIEQSVYARGLTCFTEVLESLEQTVKDVTLLTSVDNNVLFFLTDGYPNDNSPEAKVLSLSKKLAKTFTHKQIVGYSNYYNRTLLLSMAENINGSFAHVSNYSDMKHSCDTFVSNKKSVKIVDLDKCYDVIWQVSSNGVIPLTCENNKVEVLESSDDGVLYAIDYSELDSLPVDQLTDSAFVYSLAFVLSQKNKANLGVSVLRKAGDLKTAKMLQKAFTVNQKGMAENAIKALAVAGGTITKSTNDTSTTIESFLKNIKENIGKVSIDFENSVYKSISRKNADVSKVKFDVTDKNAKIVSITGNEDRANISFLTVRSGQVVEILDADLKSRVDAFNAQASSENKITLPIQSETYRNYTLVANGDFNFEKLTLLNGTDSYTIDPVKDIDLFDENQKSIKINEFVNLYKQLIAEKAHASVLRYYIKQNASQKHLVDSRVDRYGVEGAKLVEEMGFDYAMRYSPKKEYTPKDETADYIPFLEITGQLKGAATISASKSYEKMVKKGKANVGDDIVWPLFAKYDAQLKVLEKPVFVEYCQTILDSIEQTVDIFSQRISAMKFYLMITNSWFDGVEKSDEFENDGLVIKTKETKEYL